MNEPTNRPTDAPASQPADVATRDEEAFFSKLAQTLSFLEFKGTLSHAEESACRVIESRTLPGHNVYPRSSGTWEVKYFKGGKQRIWAYYDNIFSACRLADMLITQFNSGRTKHRLATITEDNLNITPERAKEDWTNEGEIKSIIIQMDAILPEIKRGRKPNTYEGFSPSEDRKEPVVPLLERHFAVLQKQIDQQTELIQQQTLFIQQLMGMVEGIGGSNSTLCQGAIFPNVSVGKNPYPVIT